MKTDKRQVVFELMRMTTQKGGTNCGLFTIAYATDLCFGEDPSSKMYIRNYVIYVSLDKFKNVL